jgi:hypothetical protein
MCPEKPVGLDCANVDDTKNEFGQRTGMARFCYDICKQSFDQVGTRSLVNADGEPLIRDRRRRSRALEADAGVTCADLVDNLPDVDTDNIHVVNDTILLLTTFPSDHRGCTCMDPNACAD